ncbi:MAG: 6-bladed beta-propeller [Gammaproteobacteria bacterium]|jgi:DNA-binding beta-propeller fold protein YncE
MTFNLRLLKPVLLFLCLALLSACAGTEHRVDYEVDAANARVWPAPPETPRYRYVGELTGEQNIKEIEESKSIGTKIADFFKMLVGLKGPNPKPVVLQRPQTGVVDERGIIYISDVSRHSIMVFDLVEGTLDEWQQATPITDFVTPIGIVLGENHSVYVADADLKIVTQLDQNGKSIKTFGDGQLERPTGIARDPLSGNIFVADTYAHNIKVFDDNGKLIDTWGSRGNKPGEFNGPTFLHFANGKLYITDTFNARVQIFTRSGDFEREFGKRGIFLGNFVRPKGITTDSEGNIYVIESFHDHLLIYNSNGEFLLPIGGTGTDVGQFYLPAGVWSDNNDRIYIADMFNGRIVILQYLGGKYAGDKAGQQKN